ncbi:mCG145909, partial [Mus musculus]
ARVSEEPREVCVCFLPPHQHDKTKNKSKYGVQIFCKWQSYTTIPKHQVHLVQTVMGSCRVEPGARRQEPGRKPLEEPPCLLRSEG